MLDYLDHLARNSARFAEVLRETAPEAAVPSCPDWNADDLLWHLGEVQWFWGTIVRERLTEGSQAEEVKPPRPGDRARLLAFFEDASGQLQEVLAATPSGTHVWTWSDDQTVGFIRRRQAHEALIHRVDAETTAGRECEMDPWLSSDGVDEALRVMYGGTPSWGTFTVEGDSELRLRTTDTGDAWLVRFGRFAGTDPADNVSYDELGVAIADTDHRDDVAATMAGTAADLDCWLWHRPTAGTLERSGDEDVLSRFESAIAAGIN